MLFLAFAWLLGALAMLVVLIVLLASNLSAALLFIMILQFAWSLAGKDWGVSRWLRG